MTGKVARIVRERGFGFISIDGRKDDVFFHMSAVNSQPGFNFQVMEEGDEVEFDVDEGGSKGPRADNISPA